MAKLKGPLLSLGASGQIGRTVVHFPWKGLNVAREYVIPSNPKTTAQNTQRGYVIAGVPFIHAAIAAASHALGVVDKTAYALLGSLHPTPRTWFNESLKQYIDQNVASKKGAIYRGCTVTPTSGQLALAIWYDKQGANDITAGNWYYGTSKSAMLSSVAGAGFSGTVTGTITGLTNGVKYYVQFRPTTHADFVSANSGIYTGTPHA